MAQESSEQITSGPVWRKRTTKQELALWLGWLVLAAFFIFCRFIRFASNARFL